MGVIAVNFGFAEEISAALAAGTAVLDIEVASAIGR